jgi:hypothetical protein
MRLLPVTLLLLALGCVNNAPTTRDEWAAQCSRIMEDDLPNPSERFQDCVKQWDAWEKANR